jgi:transcriptional regulator with XRE-family HTH domain
MPNRFSRLISLCGFTQQEAAEYLGLAHKTVSMKSAGMRKIFEEEEHQLASLWAIISDLDQPLPEGLPRGGQERRRAISEAYELNGQR